MDNRRSIGLFEGDGRGVSLRFEFAVSDRGKRSLDDVYRRVFRDHPRRSAVKQVEAEGNAAATTALRSDLSSANFVERFVAAPVSIDLKNELAPFGLRVEKLVRTHISVSEDVSKRQRDLLKQLGYNEPRARTK